MDSGRADPQEAVRLQRLGAAIEPGESDVVPSAVGGVADCSPRVDRRRGKQVVGRAVIREEIERLGRPATP